MDCERAAVAKNLACPSRARPGWLICPFPTKSSYRSGQTPLKTAAGGHSAASSQGPAHTARSARRRSRPGSTSQRIPEPELIARPKTLDRVRCAPLHAVGRGPRPRREIAGRHRCFKILLRRDRAEGACIPTERVLARALNRQVSGSNLRYDLFRFREGPDWEGPNDRHRLKTTSHKKMRAR